MRESIQLREATELKKKEKEARRIKKQTDRGEAEAQLGPKKFTPQAKQALPAPKPDQSRRYQPLPDAIFLKKKK